MTDHPHAAGPRPAGIATDAFARLGPTPFLDPYARIRRNGSVTL